MADENWINIYYQQIKEGTVLVGKWIKLLYERIQSDLFEKVYFFDQKKANQAIRYFERFCHHTKGRLAPGRLTLEPWQKAQLSCIFGLVDEKGFRQYREILDLVSRKCGKSKTASSLVSYMGFVGDGEYGGEIYCLGPKLDQADIVFSDFWQSTSYEPQLIQRVRKRKNDVYIENTNTTIRKLSFSDRKSDGFSPSVCIMDELAAWAGEPGIRQYEVMTSALGAREQPIIFSPTTANYVNDGIFDDLYKRATAFLMGNSKEKRLLPFLYQIDDISKWNSIEELRKSIPNLGVSVSIDYILEEIAKAESSLSNKAEFITKFCNIKQTASTCWMSSADIAKSFPPNHFTLADFRNCYALGGIDLAQCVDLCAAVVAIEKKGIIYYFARFFLPANKLEEAKTRDKLPYDIYIKKGFLILSGDNVVDYKDIYSWFVSLIEEYQIYVLEIGYDVWSSQYLVQDLKSYGFHCEPVKQGPNLTGIINDTEGTVKDGKLQCAEDNDLMKIHFLDSALKIEVETNKRKVVKLSKYAHVDGVHALLDMMCMRHNHWEELQDQLKNED